MVVPTDEWTLVDQALVNKLVRSGSSQIPMPPCAIGKDYRGKAPFITEVLKVQVPAELGRRNEVNTCLLQASINPAVFLFALLHVPTRQTILNLSIRPSILFNDSHPNSVVRQYFRTDGTRYGSPYDRDKVFSLLRHK